MTDEDLDALWHAEGKLERAFDLFAGDRSYKFEYARVLWDRVELIVRNDVVLVVIDDAEFAKELVDRFPTPELVAKMRLVLL